MVRYIKASAVVAVAVLLAACGGTSTIAPEQDGSTASQVTPAEATDRAPTEQPPPGTRIFQIDAANSEVRFVIGEILGGQDNTVIGVNSQISGSATVNLSQPDSSQLGVFEIQASGFHTDSSLRDRAIGQFILQSSSFPTIRFVPTSIAGLPQTVRAGETVSLQIGGELTIKDVTQTVSFATDLSVVTDKQMEGSGSATISRSDFQLEIPQVPRVAGVDEEFQLELDLVLVSS